MHMDTITNTKMLVFLYKIIRQCIVKKKGGIMKKLIIILFMIFGSWGIKSCTPEMAQWLMWNYGGYNYYFPNQWSNWWGGINHTNYYYGNIAGPFTGQIAVPFPVGFVPQRFEYRWQGNICSMYCYDNQNRMIPRMFQYRNNGFYWY